MAADPCASPHLHGAPQIARVEGIRLRLKLASHHQHVLRGCQPVGIAQEVSLAYACMQVLGASSY